jgi:CheY-like chemotaxis protein
MEATRSTPVVFLTAKAQPTEVQRLLELGARDVLTKPFDPLTIADRLAGILDD